MEAEMVVKIADSVFTAFGLGTDTNYREIKSGHTTLKRQENKWNLPNPFMASIIDDTLIKRLCEEYAINNDYTRLEQMALIVALDALETIKEEVRLKDSVFVFASTKGNVHLLANNGSRNEEVSLWTTAAKIAKHLGSEQSPLVVSNACISGLQAQLEASRLLVTHQTDTVVVIAMDMLSPFIVSGFQSFKAVSDEPCRPFDEERLGLNLGEAAACCIYQRTQKKHGWCMKKGGVFNDAYHISHPARNAEGSYLALKHVLEEGERIHLINVHGTATMYNDEMEAQAIHRAGLGDVPINSLKGYFGHTMGAAGLLETLLSMKALDDGVILGTKGFENLGVSHPVNICADNRKAAGKHFIKLISGFGGCNAAIRFDVVEE